jgi:hypothetical protein
MTPPLIMLAHESVADEKQVGMEENQKQKAEIRIPSEDDAFGIHIVLYGNLSPYACPECHGVLTMLKDGNISRLRCHTGHALIRLSRCWLLLQKRWKRAFMLPVRSNHGRYGPCGYLRRGYDAKRLSNLGPFHNHFE